MIDALALGETYTRADIDRLLGTTHIALSREGVVYIPERGVALLFVTLDKTGRDSDITYNDWFEEDFFHWDSQNQQHFETPRIADMVSGRLRPNLMVRVHQRDRGVTQPFIYAGELAYSSHEPDTRNPVHIVWESIEFTDSPNANLRDVYSWRAEASGRMTTRRGVAGRISKRRAAGQGRNQSPLERRLTETRAMLVAETWYRSEGHTVEVTAARKSWDLECMQGGNLRRVEVKGTVGGPSAVFLTINEVEAAKKDGVETDLFIVHGIELRKDEAGQITAHGGLPTMIRSWIPRDEHLRPTEFRYSVPPDRLELLRED